MEREGLRRTLGILVFLGVVIAAVLYLVEVSGPQEGPLRASGTVEAVEVVVGPETAGRVAEVYVDEGDEVTAGQPLLRLDDTLLRARRDQAEAALEAARATRRTAETSLQAARLNLERALAAARAAEAPLRESAWRQTTPSAFDQPVWYFQRQEELRAAEHEVQAAREALEAERRALEDLLQEPRFAALAEIEARLAQAREAYRVAQEVLDLSRRARDNAELRDVAESLFEAAEAELEDVQSEYEQALSDSDAEALLEARARLAAAHARYDEARDRLDALRTGEHSLEVQAARMAVEQAEAALAQAEAAVRQAEAELAALDLQLERLTVTAPIDGVVLLREVEPGEVLQPGATALTLGRLDDLRITVFIPEDRYGQLRLGQRARVEVDSFPGETFEARVVRIAERAEFTPRNVQTEEGRRTTVFAVELAVEDPAGRLKPGMPADVIFDLE